MSGDKISDMTDSLTVFPDGAFIPLVVTSNTSGLVTTANYRYNAGLYLAKLSTLAANGGAALIGTSDAITVQAALNARPTSATLAASGGAALIGYLPTGTSTIATTVAAFDDYNRYLRSYGAFADMRSALNAAFVDFAAGGVLNVNYGTWQQSLGVTFTGNRLWLIGQGCQNTIVQFTPASDNLVWMTMNNSTPGGVVQSKIENISFSSLANTRPKTFLHYVNAADCEISWLTNTESDWLGTGSVCVRIDGRQKVNIYHSTLCSERPIVIGANATSPTLSNDHGTFSGNELIGTSASFPCIEVEEEGVISNLTIEETAFVGGKQGLLRTGGTAPAASIQLCLQNFRGEQGLDDTAYLIDFEASSGNMQELTCINGRFGSDRNGVRLRNVISATFIECTFEQTATAPASVDITLVSGGRVEFINCAAYGTVTITDGKPQKLPVSARTNSYSEVWVYESGATYTGGVYTPGSTSAAGAEVKDTYQGGVPFTLANDGVRTLTDNGFIGRLIVLNKTDNTMADFNCLGGGNATQEVSDPSTQYSVTKDNAATTNIYYESSAYKLQNKRGTSVDYAVIKLGNVD